MSSSSRLWYLLQCKPREAFRALEQLGNQGYEAFLPTLRREVVRGGRRSVVTEPLFPHYVFVRLDDVTDNWAPIRSTRGVARLIMFGGQPLPVPEGVVSALQRREAAQTVEGADMAIQALFLPGQRVVITEGPFAGLNAVVSVREGDERVVLLINLLQKASTVSVPMMQLRKLDG